jgi:lysophospholipase L1-like esterase
MRQLTATLVSLVLTFVLSLNGAPAQAAVPTPDSMAAIGDSISTAYDTCCWYGNHPGSSWTTGGAGWDGVTSHYERLRSLDPSIRGHNYNDAVAGAKMKDGPVQASTAVAQHAQYVTILLGANDVCTSSPSTMTSVDGFRQNFRITLQTLIAGLPKRSRIFVSSIPDVYRLWTVYKDSSTAKFVWDTANICQSMLASERTEAERQTVRQRNIDFNIVLAEECAAYLRCRFDGNAVFDYDFERSDISKLDYFHPSLSGQADLAAVTWSRSWWS